MFAPSQHLVVFLPARSHQSPIKTQLECSDPFIKRWIAFFLKSSNDYQLEAVKTGMLPTAEIVDAVTTLIREKTLPPPVVDPVMLSTSGHDLIDDTAFSKLKTHLLSQAILVTPNIPEAERLTGIKIENEEDMRSAANVIRGFGARAVLVKGGHKATRNKTTAVDEAIDVLVDEEGNFTIYRSEYFSVGEVHGSGCTLSAAIAACLALGMNLQEAIGEAKDFVAEAIRSSEQIGHGPRPLFGER
jgi:hydroxymethylpyrimidine/phosphomethylpyrimidine kinase